MPNVTYTIELTPENAEAIDKINAILLGGAYTTEAPGGKSGKSAPAKDAAGNEVTLESLTELAKKCKKEYGQEWMLEALEELGVEVTKTLGPSIKKIPPEMYREVKKVWAAGPQESDDDDDDDDETGGEVSVDAVKDAAKAHKEEHGRAETMKVLKKHGFKALSELDDAEAEDLDALFKDLQGDDDDDDDDDL